MSVKAGQTQLTRIPSVEYHSYKKCGYVSKYAYYQISASIITLCKSPFLLKIANIPLIYMEEKHEFNTIVETGEY